MLETNMPSTPPDRWPWLSDDIKGESDAARIAAQAEANNLAEALREVNARLVEVTAELAAAKDAHLMELATLESHRLGEELRADQAEAEHVAARAALASMQAERDNLEEVRRFLHAQSLDWKARAEKCEAERALSQAIEDDRR